MPDDTLFDQNLINPENPSIPTDDENRQLISDELEKDYLKKIRAKNKKLLIKLDYLERERVAKYIHDLYIDKKSDQDELADDIDKWDDIYRMKPFNPPGSDENTPNYRTPLSTTTLEVTHANIMNVFFSPADVMRVIPTEQGDIPKVKKLDTFGNWSMKNEMKLFQNIDRLFHSSTKNGEAPYMVYWSKEYGTEIKTELVMNPMNPTEPLIDEDTKEPITQEREVEKKLYDGPKLEVFSRKDYILPKNATLGKKASWEMRRLRKNADEVNRACLEGKYYDSAFDDIGGWGAEGNQDDRQNDSEKQDIPLGKTEKVFVEWYGRMRVNAVKAGEQDEEQYEELEDEFIAIVEVNSQVLLALKKNKFPLKDRPFGLDIFIPDDEGRLEGIGVMEFMESIQNCNDALYNQYLTGTIQANDPFGFFTPLGNMKNEPIKIKHGYLYPTSDASSVNVVKLPAPDASLLKMMELARNYAQLLFGISDYAAGLESQIDPRAPARKAEIVVAQGNVRLNLIIKRKNDTLKDIFRRWFLLYQANMPPNKFMRIAGEGDSPWKFEAINMTDFALTSIPDFELTGNILNSNKTLETQKKLGIYQVLIANPLFSPQTQQGLQALHALTKWLLDGLDETGVSGFLPRAEGQYIETPEEENARFLQGDVISPAEKEDHIQHIKVHTDLIANPALPDNIRKVIIRHVQETTDLLKKLLTQQIVMSLAKQPQIGGQYGGQNPLEAAGAPTSAPAVLPVADMGAP